MEIKISKDCIMGNVARLYKGNIFIYESIGNTIQDAINNITEIVAEEIQERLNKLNYKGVLYQLTTQDLHDCINKKW